MKRDEIMEEVGATTWSTVVAAFDDLAAKEIKDELDKMFPDEDNDELARAIEEALI